MTNPNRTSRRRLRADHWKRKRAHQIDVWNETSLLMVRVRVEAKLRRRP
jgi:hypothetical protein